MRRVIFFLIRALLLMPIATLVYLSLQNAWRFPVLWSGSLSWQHWQNTWNGTNGLLDSLLISLGLSGSVALLCASMGFAVSGVVMRQSSSRLWLSLAYFPYLIAPVVLGAMLQFYFVRIVLSGSMSGVMIAQCLFVFPYAVLFFSGFWNPRIRQIMAQARTLGAAPTQVLLRILWPMGRPWLVMGVFQCFLLSWFEYGLTRLIGVGKVPTLTIQTLYYVQEANPHLAAVASLLMVFPTLCLLMINRQVFFRKPFQTDSTAN